MTRYRYAWVRVEELHRWFGLRGCDIDMPLQYSATPQNLLISVSWLTVILRLQCTYKGRVVCMVWCYVFVYVRMCE